MAIFRKDHLAGDKAGLTRYYQELLAALEGTTPLAGQAAQFQPAPDDFQRDFTDIDLVELAKSVGRFKVEVDYLKKIKERAVKPAHR